MKSAKTPSDAAALWPVVLLTIMVKYAYYAFTYYPVVDDNNMYGTFRLYNNIFTDVIIRYSTYATRPFAALIDGYVWSRLWDNLWITLAAVTFLHFVICFLLYKVFEKNGLKIGVIPLLIFALLPFGSEATYWLAASSRIVVGLFFMVLSLYFLTLYLNSEDSPARKPAFISLFFITHLISLGFYEQVIALSFFALIIIFIARWKDIKAKGVVLLPLINFAAIAAWYKIFGTTGANVGRSQIVTDNFLWHTREVLRAIYNVWKGDFIEFFQTSLIQSFQTIISDKAFIFLAGAVLLSLGVILITSNERVNTSVKTNLLKLFLGIFLFAVSYAPFFVLNTIWICNRNLFLSFFGLGLAVEAIFNIISRSKGMNLIKGVLIGLLAFSFLVGNVFELSYYRSVSTIDREVVSKIMKAPEAADYMSGQKSLVLFNTREFYVNTTSKRIGNCTAADWALTGAIVANAGKDSLKYASPVPPETNWAFKKELLKSSVLLGMDDSRNMFPVKVSSESEKEIILSKEDGTEYAKLELLDADRVMLHISK